MCRSTHSGAATPAEPDYDNCSSVQCPSETHRPIEGADEKRCRTADFMAPTPAPRDGGGSYAFDYELSSDEWDDYVAGYSYYFGYSTGEEGGMGLDGGSHWDGAEEEYCDLSTCCEEKECEFTVTYWVYCRLRLVVIRQEEYRTWLTLLAVGQYSSPREKRSDPQGKHSPIAAAATVRRKKFHAYVVCHAPSYATRLLTQDLTPASCTRRPPNNVCRVSLIRSFRADGLWGLE